MRIFKNTLALSKPVLRAANVNIENVTLLDSEPCDNCILVFQKNYQVYKYLGNLRKKKL
jgi:hypothetical protein